MARKRRGAYSNKDLEARAISIVKDEKIRWELATAFVTPRVNFKMRQLIRILRKNYYGVFDEPTDPMTGQEKVWYPLTEINVEAVVKNIDLDQKDIGFRAKTPDSYGITDITRAFVKDKLDKLYFGQKLDDFERSLAIDGTAVWKTIEQNGKMLILPVDILNVYIDPTTPSIQEAYRFTERSLMFPEEILAMNGWINTEGVEANVTEGLPRTDPFWMNRTMQFNSNVKMVDVYELWGKIPKSLITGEAIDDTEEVEGRIVCSNIDSPGKERLHLIELNTKTDAEGNYLKPYEECWYTRVPNRWYGRGVAEKVLMLQVYANMVLNFRINRSRISQLGLFQIRKGSGITPQMLSRLPSNGAIVVNNMDDLQQLIVQEVGATSYTDENTINSIAERLTNAFDVVTGEAMPASTPATNASIQNTNAKSGFAMIKDTLGYFLRRWMDRHALPIFAKELDAGALVRLATDDTEMQPIIERIVAYQAGHALQKYYEHGSVPSPQELQLAMMEAMSEFKKHGEVFIKLLDKVVAEGLETEVYVTNEQMDVAVTLQNLISMLQAAPEYHDAIIKMAFDLMGLPQPAQPQQQPQQPQGPQPPQPGGGPMAAQQLQALTTRANVAA